METFGYYLWTLISEYQREMVQRRLSIASRSTDATAPYPQIAPFSRVQTILDHPRGPDWVHPSVVVHDTGRIGLGLVTLDLIARGSQVILFGGALMSWREVMALPEDMRDIPFQVADDVFFGIPNRSDIGIGERINHSCNPNLGFVSEMKLVALRDILPREDVTMDYATCTSMEDYHLVCRCGEKNCRGVVRGTDWQLPDVQHRLGKYYQPYLRNKLYKQQKHSVLSRLSSLLRSAADALAAVS